MEKGNIGLKSGIMGFEEIISIMENDYRESEKEWCVFEVKRLYIENSDLKIKAEDLEGELLKLREELRLLKKKSFGKKSERVVRQLEELEGVIEEREMSLCLNGGYKIVEKKRGEKGKAKRKKFSESLPREEIIVESESRCPECGGEEFRKIEDDVSEVLEYVPASFKVIKYVRERSACICCEKIVQAEAASKTIDKGNAGPGLLSHVILQKYCDHLPFYRQSEMFEREGIEIARSTMAGWAGRVATLLKPLAEKIKEVVMEASEIHGDDTPIKVLDALKGKSKTGRIWTYLKDGRPHGDCSPAAILYYYSPDRKGIRPQEHLEGYEGVLHADAYAGYNALYEGTAENPGVITEAGCWAHTRRKFYEITVASDNATIAYEVVEQIAKIYEIEEEIRGELPEIRLQARQERSKVLVDELFEGFRDVKKKLSQKGRTAKAIQYALNNEEALKRFLVNGRIEIDNNSAERALRKVALGRKNWLFAGSDQGGHTAATFYTIIETARINGVNPWLYLKKVLSVIQDYNSQKLHELLPWNIFPNTS